MRIKKSTNNSKGNKEVALKNSECIGMHITAQAIHTVLLNMRSVNQIRLEKYAITPLPRHILNDNSIQDYDQFVSYLQQSVRQLGSGCKNITTSLPQSLVSLQILQYNPKQTELSLDEYMELEVSQTGDLEDINYDYCVLKEHESNPVLLLVSCKREDVDVRLDALNAANITPKQMDVDVLAVLNAVSTWINHEQPELAEQSLATFHIDHHTTSALITQHGRLLYKQEINLGHEHLMQIIRRSYQLNEDEAWALMHASDKPDDFDHKAGSLFQNQLVQEIQRFLQFYYTTSSHDLGNEVRQILVCGYPGGASANMAEHIAHQINIPTRQINPVLAIQASSHLNQSQLLNDSHLLTVAFGLALRGL